MLAFVSMAFVNDAAQFEALPGDHEITTVAADAKLALLDGEEIYMTRCLSCHMANGEGVPGVFPPLAESEYVTGDKGVLVVSTARLPPFFQGILLQLHLHTYSQTIY